MVLPTGGDSMSVGLAATAELQLVTYDVKMDCAFIKEKKRLFKEVQSRRSILLLYFISLS